MIKKIHASEQQKKLSRSKITVKLRVLHKWSNEGLPWQTDNEGSVIRDSNGDKIVEWFPRNNRQFCEWDGSQCSSGTQQLIPVLNSISRQTFYREYNEDLKNQAEDLFNVLIALEEKMKASSSNASEISKLKRDISYWQSVAEAEANAVLDIMQRLNEIEKLYNKAERIIKNNEEQLQIEIRTLKAENATLNKVVAKITPLKGVD